MSAWDTGLLRYWPLGEYWSFSGSYYFLVNKIIFLTRYPKSNNLSSHLQLSWIMNTPLWSAWLTWNCLMFALLHLAAGTSSKRMIWIEDARALCLAPMSRSGRRKYSVWDLNIFKEVNYKWLTVFTFFKVNNCMTTCSIIHTVCRIWLFLPTKSP